MISQRDLERLSDAELLKIIAETGDSRALEIMMVSHGSFVKGIVHGYLGKTIYEQDAFIDIWMKAYNKLREGGYHEEDHFPNMLGQIAHNHCKDELRKNLNKIFVKVYKDGEEFLPAGGLSPEQLLARDDEVRYMLSLLPDVWREIVVKRYLEDKSPEQTALEMKMPVDNVSAYLCKALKFLEERAGKQ